MIAINIFNSFGAIELKRISCFASVEPFGSKQIKPTPSNPARIKRRYPNDFQRIAFAFHSPCFDNARTVANRWGGRCCGAQDADGQQPEANVHD
jgi:hypothetical protein